MTTLAILGSNHFTILHISQFSSFTVTFSGQFMTTFRILKVTTFTILQLQWHCGPLLTDPDYLFNGVDFFLTIIIIIFFRVTTKFWDTTFDHSLKFTMNNSSFFFTCGLNITSIPGRAGFEILENRPSLNTGSGDWKWSINQNQQKIPQNIKPEPYSICCCSSWGYS